MAFYSIIHLVLKHVVKVIYSPSPILYTFSCTPTFKHLKLLTHIYGFIFIFSYKTHLHNHLSNGISKARLAYTSEEDGRL